MASLSSTLNSAVGSVVGQATSGITSAIVGSAGSNVSWLTQGGALPDPLLSIDWDINMPFNLNSTYVEEVSTPMVMNLNPGAPIRRGPYSIFMAESVEAPPVSMTFYEDRKLTVSNWLRSWQSLIYDFQTGGFGVPGNSASANGYKRVITLTPKDTTQTTVGTIYLIGIWPTSADSVTFNSDTTSRIQMRVNFQLERVAFVTANNSIFSSILTTLGNSAKNTLVSAATGALSGASKKLTSKLSIK